MNTLQSPVPRKNIIEKILDGDSGTFGEHVKAAAVGASAVFVPFSLLCAVAFAAAVAYIGVGNLFVPHDGPSSSLKSGQVPLPNTNNWKP